MSNKKITASILAFLLIICLNNIGLSFVLPVFAQSKFCSNSLCEEDYHTYRINRSSFDCPGLDEHHLAPQLACPDKDDFVPDEILVRFKPGSCSRAPGTALLHKKLGAQVKQAYHFVEGLQLLDLPPGMDMAEALAYYNADPNVLYAEPNYIVRAIGEVNLSVMPNDRYYGQQWALPKIKVPTTWNVTTGSEDIIVAVIDTGVDYNHPDIAPNMWFGRGYNYINRTNYPMDDNGHGTHVAGIIAAVGNNEIGIAGVMWQARIMAIKFLDDEGSGSVSDAISAIRFATQNGAKIINNSWGKEHYSRALKDAIAASGVIHVCAAGNNGVSNDSMANRIYPASFNLPNIISVAATAQNDTLTDFSNYGKNTVDVAAPGYGILSTIPGGYYNYMDGTSMAAPHITGIVGLILSAFPELSINEVRQAVLGEVDNISALNNRVTTGGRVNARKSLDRAAIFAGGGHLAGFGDVNEDGLININDAILILQYLVGLKNFTTQQLERALVSGNSRLTVIDAILVLRYTVGIIQNFPAAGQMSTGKYRRGNACSS